MAATWPGVSPIDADGNVDLSPYPPPPVLWFTSLLDTMCIPLRCGGWRSLVGIPDHSWLAAKVPAIMDSAVDFASFPEFYQEHYNHNNDEGQAPLSWMDILQLNNNNAEDDSAALSFWSTLRQYCFETTSTALGDLSTPTAMVVLCLLVVCLRSVKSVLLPLFSSLGRWTGRRTHGVEWERANEERIAKFGEYVFRLLYHSLISIYGVYYFWDKEWWAAGGTITLFQGFPNHPVEPGMAWYYLLQSAYNLDAMLSLVVLSFVVRTRNPVNKRGQLQLPVTLEWSSSVRGDFREMMIHHVVTNLLVIGSSMCRLTRIGSMVFLVHDLSDIPVDLSKLANFLKWKWTTLGCFLSMVGVWMATRLYILPFKIFRSVLTESQYCLDYGLSPLLYIHYRHFFYVLVALLIVLHVAWFVMFLQIFSTFLRKNECHDLSEHKEGEKQGEHTPKTLEEETTTPPSPAYAQHSTPEPPPREQLQMMTKSKRISTDVYSEEKKDN